MHKYFLVAVMFSTLASASTMLINFETVPVEPAGPSLFATAGAAQTITVPGVAAISGGVILGDETNLSLQAFGTPPNVYATAGFGHDLSSALTISFNAAFPVTQVSFPLFNGDSISESYIITAYNGAGVVASQTLTNLASNASGGYAIADLTSANISSLTIAPAALNDPSVNGWDFSIDSIALNESVQQAFAPEPSGLALLGLSAIVLFSLLVTRGTLAGPTNNSAPSHATLARGGPRQARRQVGAAHSSLPVPDSARGCSHETDHARPRPA